MNPISPSPLRFVAAVAACTVVLFVWSGASQIFPWGVPTVRSFAQTSGNPSSFGTALVKVAPGTLTTNAFDEQMGDGIYTLTTDRSFAWIVSVPLARYDPARYFLVELLCQLVCSLLLVTAMIWLAPLPRRRRAAVLGVLALGAIVGTYGVMTNWWGLPLLYSVGMSANFMVGWLAAAVVATAILERCAAVRER
jgi:hypothetical protein